MNEERDYRPWPIERLVAASGRSTEEVLRLLRAGEIQGDHQESTWTVADPEARRWLASLGIISGGQANQAAEV